MGVAVHSAYSARSHSSSSGKTGRTGRNFFVCMRPIGFRSMDAPPATIVRALVGRLSERGGSALAAWFSTAINCAMAVSTAAGERGWVTVTSPALFFHSTGRRLSQARNALTKTFVPAAAQVVSRSNLGAAASRHALLPRRAGGPGGHGKLPRRPMRAQVDRELLHHSIPNAGK